MNGLRASEGAPGRDVRVRAWAGVRRGGMAPPLRMQRRP